MVFLADSVLTQLMAKGSIIHSVLHTSTKIKVNSISQPQTLQNRIVIIIYRIPILAIVNLVSSFSS